MNKKKGEREREGARYSEPKSRKGRNHTQTNQRGEKGGGRSTDSPGTSLARETRCQMGRRTMSQVRDVT